MTEKEALELMKKIDPLDICGGHVDADDILCEVLKSIGFSELIEEYDKIIKWYA